MNSLLTRSPNVLSMFIFPLLSVDMIPELLLVNRACYLQTIKHYQLIKVDHIDLLLNQRLHSINTQIVYKPSSKNIIPYNLVCLVHKICKTNNLQIDSYPILNQMCLERNIQGIQLCFDILYVVRPIYDYKSWLKSHIRHLINGFEALFNREYPLSKSAEIKVTTILGLESLKICQILADQLPMCDYENIKDTLFKNVLTRAVKYQRIHAMYVLRRYNFDAKVSLDARLMASKIGYKHGPIHRLLMKWHQTDKQLNQQKNRQWLKNRQTRPLYFF